MAADEIRETKNRIAYTVMIVRDFCEAHHPTPPVFHHRRDYPLAAPTAVRMEVKWAEDGIKGQDN